MSVSPLGLLVFIGIFYRVIPRLTTENCSIAIIGEEQPFKELNNEELQSLISDLDQTKVSRSMDLSKGFNPGLSG